VAAVGQVAAAVSVAAAPREDGRMEIPCFARGYLKPVDISRIQEAIQQAERHTSGEIVPMVVQRSSTIGHVSLILFFGLVGVFALFDGLLFQVDGWGMGPWVYFLVLPVFWGVSLFQAKCSFTQRLCISPQDRLHQVQGRALVEFHEFGLEKTAGGTGVLIFVSLMERMVVVLADKGIADKLPKDTWEQLVQDLIHSIKQKELARGFTDAILQCGELLKPHFPIQPDDVNELKNQLILKP
jgi:putative membrane protein